MYNFKHLKMNKNNIIIDYNLTPEQKEELDDLYSRKILKKASDDNINFINEDYHYTLSNYKFDVVTENNYTYTLIAN